MVRLCFSVPDCDIGLRDEDGCTAFDVALCAGEVIPLLFYSSVFEMDATDPQGALLRMLTVSAEPAGERPLFPGQAMFAPVGDSNVPLVKALIERGVDHSVRNADGDTALNAAARMGNVEIARRLVGAGSNVNAVGKGEQHRCIVRSFMAWMRRW